MHFAGDVIERKKRGVESSTNALARLVRTTNDKRAISTQPSESRTNSKPFQHSGVSHTLGWRIVRHIYALCGWPACTNKSSNWEPMVWWQGSGCSKIAVDYANRTVRFFLWNTRRRWCCLCFLCTCALDSKMREMAAKLAVWHWHGIGGSRPTFCCLPRSSIFGAAALYVSHDVLFLASLRPDAGKWGRRSSCW